MRKVAITHVAQSSGVESRESLMDFTYRVNKEILDKAGLKREDVGCIIAGAADIFHSGLSCANAFDWDGIGAFLKEGSRAEESAMSFIYGCMRIMSGYYDTVLVTALVKGSENPDNDPITSFYGDPFYLRPLGVNESSVAALQMRQYMERYRVTEEQCAKVVVKNLGNALRNPCADRKRRISIEDVMRSERVYDPLKALECAPKSDGVVAVLLASESRAKKLTKKPVWLAGYGCSMDHFNPGDRNLLNGHLRIAAEKAYRAAGIRDPRKRIHVAEVCEPYAFQELLWCEQLGFCNEGKGGHMIDSGMTEMDGELPVNPSGGVLATNPYPARGLYRIAEAALQVKGEAGEHQVGRKVKTALAHSTHGFGGQCHSVVILSA
ncbi:MAG: thiolase family protein [Syntrophales bacterium]|jgi:acetyl-CoA C-acetyltransferase|nr:thiolase family protein [Syntrophales bacterium]